MTFSTEVELTEIPRLLTPDLEYKPCFARYADCVHNGNPASPRGEGQSRSKLAVFCLMR
ncbi:hypothetical protein IMSAG192_01154 [Muribaculaceae bacterium]|nr:hypothetical protein IMSAG192_01154 [Muribaculaceae bacterium]